MGIEIETAEKRSPTRRWVIIGGIAASLTAAIIGIAIAWNGSTRSPARSAEVTVTSPPQPSVTDPASTTSSTTAPAVVPTTTDMCDNTSPCDDRNETSTTVASVAATPTTDATVIDDQTTVVATIGSGHTTDTIVEHDSLVIANPDGTVTEVEPGPVVTPPPAQTPTTTTPSPAQDGYDAAVDYLMATTQWPAPPSIPGFVLLSPEMTFQRVDLEEGVDGSLNDAVFIIGRYRYQVIDGYAGFNDPLGWCAAIRDALPGLLSETACTMNDGHWSPPAAIGHFNGGLWANFYYELDPGSLSRLQFETSVLLKDVP